MTNEPTPAERALSTQAAKLQTQAAAQTRGGFWDVVGQIIPAWVLIAAVVVFGGFEAFKHWQQIQQSDAQTRIKQADAALAAIEASALNRKDDGGDTLALAKAKAELDKAQADAARAKVEADALGAKVGDVSMRLEQLKAELAAKSAKAAQTRLEARAALDRSGLLTLEQRAARAKLEITELKAAKSRWDAAVKQTDLSSGSMVFDESKWHAAKMIYLKAYCNDNPFARDAGCPPQFITREPPRIQTALEAALEQAGGTEAPAAPATTNSGTAPPKAGVWIGVVNTLNLTLRPCPKPTKDCPEILRIPQGARIRVLGDADQTGWLGVEVALRGGGTQKGFVNGKYVARESAANQ